MLSDEQLLGLLQSLDLSWEGYRRVRKGVKKRLQRRIQDLDLKRWGDYLKLLQISPAELKHCRLLLSISISRFMRDSSLWRMLEMHILPGLAHEPIIRVWSAGCARGEEAYSLKMVLHRLERHSGRPLPLSILASDLNPAYLEQAQIGIYQKAGLRELSEVERRTYFEKLPAKNLVRIKDFLREGIIWRKHDLLRDRSPGRFEIILMRNNLFTYEGHAQQEAALGLVSGSLARGGFLIIGRRERLPEERKDYRPYLGTPFIFRNYR